MGKKKEWIYSLPQGGNRSLAADTIDLARRDLEAAQLLYDAQLYPQAVYFLQQGVEKGWKSVGFQYGIIDEIEAQHRVSHTPSEVSRKSCALLQRIINTHLSILRRVKHALGQELESVNQDLAYFSGLEDQMVCASGEFEKIKNDPYRYQTVSKEHLDEILTRCQESERGLDTITTLLKDREYSDEVYAVIRREARKRLKRAFRNIPYKRRKLQRGFKQLQKEDIESLIKLTLHGTVIVEPLLHLAIITQPHESLTRYASTKEGGYSPVRAYTQDNPLVQRFEDLHMASVSSLAHLAEFYKMMPEKWPSNTAAGGTP